MKPLLTHAIDLLHAWGPWIVGSLIPSLIIGLTNAPKGRKVADWLKVMLQVASVVTHRDERGTFKLPLLARMPPKTPAVAPPALVLLLALLASAVSSGIAVSCGTTGPLPPVVPIVVDCTVAVTVDTAAQVLPAVTSALTSGQFVSELAKLVSKWGEAFIACLVQQVGSEAVHAQAVAPSDGLARTRAENARAWLTTNQVTFK